MAVSAWRYVRSRLVGATSRVHPLARDVALEIVRRMELYGTAWESHSRWAGLSTFLVESTEHAAWRQDAADELTQWDEIASHVDGDPALPVAAGDDLSAAELRVTARLADALKVPGASGAATTLVELAIEADLPPEPRSYVDAAYGESYIPLDPTSNDRTRLEAWEIETAMRSAIDAAEEWIALTTS